MKKWKKPEITTISEEYLKELIVTGACSYFCYMQFVQPTIDE